MKFVWEVCDFERTDIRPTGFPVKGDSQEICILGWQQGFGNAGLTNHYTLTSLRDGMVTTIGNKQDAVGWLNKYNYAPLFKFIDLTEMLKK